MHMGLTTHPILYALIKESRDINSRDGINSEVETLEPQMTSQFLKLVIQNNHHSRNTLHPQQIEKENHVPECLVVNGYE